MKFEIEDRVRITGGVAKGRTGRIFGTIVSGSSYRVILDMDGRNSMIFNVNELARVSAVDRLGELA